MRYTRGSVGIKNKQSGFTIVELLIVIVVIGILAAIVIVAFNGVQNRAKDTSIQSDLKNIAGLLEQHRVVNDTLPTSLLAASMKSLGTVSVAKDAYGNHYNNGSGLYNLLYCRGSNGNDFALVAASTSGKTYQYSSLGGGVKEHGPPLTSSATICRDRLGIDPYAAWWGHNGPGWINGL